MAAIGSPFGERQSLSVGVISAVDRNISSLTRFGIGDAIQTDAAINPGNSGGPLLDAKGAVLGINAQIKTNSGGGEGVGFAIPVDAVRRSLRELRADGRVDYGYLGVTTLSLWPQLARRLGAAGAGGALVQGVEDGQPRRATPACAPATTRSPSRASPGIVTGGDVILAVDGEQLTRSHDLTDVISAYGAGDTVDAHGAARRRAPRGEGRARAAARRLRQLNAPGAILAMLKAWRRCPTWLTVGMSR